MNITKRNFHFYFSDHGKGSKDQIADRVTHLG
uniref:Uncharacterized protein n=1 Tax=Arundo donax TaxID=35708 RepID=A0A0A8Z0C7_ARUDO